MTRTCEACGALFEFAPGSGRPRRFCPTCRPPKTGANTKRAVEPLCLRCGGPIDRRTRPRSAYCSTVHQIAARDAKVYVRRRPVAVTCGCGRSFMVGGRGPLPRYCPDCQQARAERSEAWRARQGNTRRKCAICGREFRAKAKIQPTCSRRCGVELKRRHRAEVS